ncbi:glutathione hydrolase 1 proenzyme-like isoform X2 [Sitophilus oryzae]|nr:glutathione hydrolase 1 proenzyme-like isoform X2 [Sitophilus oryzae]XP_030763771.1 glutathione hydrolase 1 proenzyme-like isoform X2 [Sitophilus oryzae]
MGLGGGFLMTIYEKETGKVRSLNSREVAPGAATVNMYNGSSSLAQRGGLSVAVPGELKGYWTLHQEYGKLPWKDLVQPTIDMCKEGIYVTAFLARIYLSSKDLLMSDPVLRDIFIDPSTTEPYIEGQYVKILRFAKTLEIIADEGVHALYSANGSLIKGFVDDIKQNNGIITEEDLINYQPEWQEPVRAVLNDNHTLYTSPLPGSGVVLTYILNILDGLLNLDQLYTTQTVQRIIESFKFGYGHRTLLGDANFVNVTELVANLTSKSYAKDIRSKIFDDRTSQDPTYYGAKASLVEDHGTAHISILAPNGDAISVTSTINYVFGAGFASNSTGIILNDEMDDFALPNVTNLFGLAPSEANFIAPGKRPLSSMVPSIIVKDDDVVLVTGAAGGTKITTVIASILVKHLWYDVDIQTAMDDKRVHHQLSPMTVEFEEGFNETYPDISRDIVSIGHEVKYTPTSNGFSAVTSVTTKNGEIKGAYDIRRGGYISYMS